MQLHLLNTQTEFQIFNCKTPAANERGQNDDAIEKHGHGDGRGAVQLLDGREVLFHDVEIERNHRRMMRSAAGVDEGSQLVVYSGLL
jgi:hypothetical protein